MKGSLPLSLALSLPLLLALSIPGSLPLSLALSLSPSLWLSLSPSLSLSPPPPPRQTCVLLFDHTLFLFHTISLNPTLDSNHFNTVH